MAALLAQAAELRNNLSRRSVCNHRASDGAPIAGADRVIESGNLRTIALKQLY